MVCNGGCVDFGSAAVAAVSQVGVDGLLAGCKGGGLVTDGALEVGENIEGFPRLSDVAERSFAFDSALDFATGFIVAAELD